MKKHKVVCNNCNSIVNGSFEKLSYNWHNPIHKRIRDFNKQIKKMESLAQEGLDGTSSFWVGHIYRRLYFSTIREIDDLKKYLEKFEEYLEYTHYYKCPICNNITYIKLK